LRAGELVGVEGIGQAVEDGEGKQPVVDSNRASTDACEDTWTVAVLWSKLAERMMLAISESRVL
jgi:hypothetical protein